MFPIYFVFFGVVSTQSVYASQETVKDLLANYNKSESPFDETNPLKIEIGLMVGRINYLDVKQSTLNVELSLSLSWYDPRLNWTGKISSSQMPETIGISLLWMAPYTIFNRAKMEETRYIAKTYIQKGNIDYYTNMLCHTICIPTTKWFPYDVQSCNLEFGIPIITNQNGELLRESDKHVLHWIMKNSKWNIIKYYLKESTYSPLPNSEITYPSSTYTIVMARTDEMSALTLLCPALLCAVLGVLPYCISPIDGFGLRFGLSASSLLVSIQTIKTICSILPLLENSTPIIVQFCITCSIIVMLSIGQTIWMSFVGHYRTKPSQMIQAFAKSLPANFLLKLFWGINFREAAPSSGGLPDQNQLLDQDKNDDSILKDVSWNEVLLLVDSMALLGNLLTLVILFLTVAITE